MLKKEEVKSILLIGISGGLAQITAKVLEKTYPHAIVTGIDSRKVDPAIPIKNLVTKSLKYTRGNFEQLFRNHSFDVVLQLGRTSYASQHDHINIAKKLDLNLMGTTAILDLCLKFQVKKFVLLSSYHIYGALADNPVFFNEESPIKASHRYEELRDVVETDQVATTWLWKNQNSIRACVLRTCNIIGPQIRNVICNYLRSPYSPVPIDYNPMFQFIHEYDMANVIQRAITELPSGVYNVAPDDYLSIGNAKKLVGANGIPSSIFAIDLLAYFLKHINHSVPYYFLDYLKFSCLLDNNLIKKHLGEDFLKFNTQDALNLLKNA